MSMPWWHTFTVDDLKSKSHDDLVDGMVRLLKHHDTWIRNAREENHVLKKDNARLTADMAYLRQHMCGSICHGDDYACFYRGGDVFLPCPLATEADIDSFLKNAPQMEEDHA